MLFGAIDHSTLFHILYGVWCAHARLRLGTMLAVAWAWEWFEETDIEPLDPLPGWGRIINPSPLNAIVDVAVAVVGYYATLRLERRVKERRGPDPAAHDGPSAPSPRSPP